MSKSIVPNGTPPRQASTPHALDRLLAAIYARVSTQDQADKGYSLPTQIEACQQLAQHAGYTVLESHIFVDDYTGTSLNRPQFTRLRDLVGQRLVQAVIVHDLDRLSRKLAHQLLLSDEFEQAGVTLHVVTMPAHDKTPETQLLSNVRGIIAEYERAKLLERTMRGLRGRAKEGFVPSGNVPLGYEYVRLEIKGAHYVINHEEAALVQRIFQMYVQSGLAINAIAQQLTRERLPTQSDRRARGPSRKMSMGTWQPSSIFHLLSNETYIGTLYYGKTESSYSPNSPDKKTTHRMKPREEWIAIPVPPIIDQDTFAAAQRRLQDNAQMSKRNRKLEYLLCNSRLRCGQCGSVMTGQFNPQRAHRFYRCSRPPYHNPLPCRRTVSAHAIEGPVWQKVEEVLQNPELIAREVQRRAEHADTEQGTMTSERACFARQLEQCDKELKKWEAAYIADVITLEDLKTKKAEIGARRTSAEQELARLAEQQRVLEQAARETASLVEYCARVRENLSGLSMEEKRVALSALSITVYWRPDAPLEIHGSIPMDFAYNTPGCVAGLARH